MDLDSWPKVRKGWKSFALADLATERLKLPINLPILSVPEWKKMFSFTTGPFKVKRAMNSISLLRRCELLERLDDFDDIDQFWSAALENPKDSIIYHYLQKEKPDDWDESKYFKYRFCVYELYVVKKYFF